MGMIHSVQAVNMNVPPFGMGVIASEMPTPQYHGTSVRTMDETAEVMREVAHTTRGNLEAGRRMDNSRLGSLGDLASIKLPDVHSVITDQMAGLSVIFDKYAI